MKDSDVLTFLCILQLPVVVTGQLFSILEFIRLTHHNHLSPSFPNSVSVVRGDWVQLERQKFQPVLFDWFGICRGHLPTLGEYQGSAI